MAYLSRIFYESYSSKLYAAYGRAENVAEIKRIVAAYSESLLFGNNSCDFLSCDKHLTS